MYSAAVLIVLMSGHPAHHHKHCHCHCVPVAQTPKQSAEPPLAQPVATHCKNPHCTCGPNCSCPGCCCDHRPSVVEKLLKVIGR